MQYGLNNNINSITNKNSAKKNDNPAKELLRNFDGLKSNSGWQRIQSIGNIIASMM